MENRKNEILYVSFSFAIQIIEYCELLESKRKYVIAKQLLRSGTSVGANIREAQNAESRREFIHKLKISAKEADESEYWLLLCEGSKNYPNPSPQLKAQLTSIKKLLSKIISSSKNPKK